MNNQQVTKFIFQTTDILKVQDFLSNNPDLDPRDYPDKKKNNVLHILSFGEQKDLIKMYINHTTKLIQNKMSNNHKLYEQDAKQQIAGWINTKNHEGFTPLLYAAFNGDVEMIKYLLEKGANPSVSNDTELTVLHMAAQNNKIATFIYFQGKVDFNLSDQKGGTPLHWAAYCGHQELVAYLLSKKSVKIDLKNRDGETALFLATVYGNTRIVRRLLISGANRKIKNNQGTYPIQVAKAKQYFNISKMLDDEYSFLDFVKFYYNVKVQYRPTNRSLQIPIVFLITAICSLLILHGLIVFKHNYMYVLEGIIVGTMILLYLSLLIPPKKQAEEDIKNYIKETKKICFQCSRRKPRRSYHCDICKVCIQQYDHHCTWINNCVGKKNIGRFIVFIVLLLCSLGIIGITATWGWLSTANITSNTVLDSLMEFRENTEDNFQKWAKIILFFINIIVSLFTLPILLLFVVQVKNLCMNKTTFERMRGQNSEVRDQLKQKKKRGPSIANCRAMCSNTRESFSSQQSGEQQLLE